MVIERLEVKEGFREFNRVPEGFREERRVFLGEFTVLRFS